MNAIEHATKLLVNGKLVAIPTETVYGLGANAKNPAAVQKIYAVKGRPASNPLIIHIPNSDAMTDWAIHIPEAAWRLAAAFWPGPLTLVLSRHPSVPPIVTGGQDTIALRIPNHPLTLELLHAFKGGIAAPSANRYGRLSPTTAKHVRTELGESVDYILEGGPCSVGIESTILDLSGATPSILRPGSISKEALIAVLKENIFAAHGEVQVPGLSLSHYAPVQPLYLLDRSTLLTFAERLNQEQRFFSVLSFDKLPANNHANAHNWVEASPDPMEYAKALYHNLRSMDEKAPDCILVESPPNTEAWLAIRDRLQRAAYSSTPWSF